MEWDFLKDMLKYHGFNEKTTKIVMECVSTVPYSFQMNGNHTGLITPQRGLRQECPLSPYLFILCVEALSKSLNLQNLNGNLRGIKINKFAPPMTHLMYADDLFIFGRTTVLEVQIVQESLRIYEKISGQMINKNKSGIWFSKNTDQSTRTRIISSLEVKALDGSEMYLGFPLVINRKFDQWYYIKERCSDKLARWKTNLLSTAGRTELIKSTLANIPHACQKFSRPSQECYAISGENQQVILVGA